MSGRLDERFKVVPGIIAASSTQYSEALAANEDILESKVEVPSRPPVGLTYRFKMSGTKTGANGAMAVILKLGATAVCTLTAPGNTADDYIAEFTIRWTSTNAQKIMGTLVTNAVAAVVDYADGTVNCSAGSELMLQITNAHTSDVVYCNLVTVESWVK